jgi:2-keto-4-pentenoate hydratase
MQPWTNTEIRKAAEFIVQGHATRSNFSNLPESIAPPSVEQAYDVQDEVVRQWADARGPIAGLKIATTTKVMQQLMGIGHPCAGVIFGSRVFQSPASVDVSDHVHLMAECELAVRLGRDLDSIGTISKEEAIAAISDIAPAFELIEDRHARHDRTGATSLIADNAWNAGIVHGEWRRFSPADRLETQGHLQVNGVRKASGTLDDPFTALAWLANHAKSRGRALRSGMVVITGSLIATFELASQHEYEFSLGSLGATVIRCL